MGRKKCRRAGACTGREGRPFPAAALCFACFRGRLCSALIAQKKGTWKAEADEMPRVKKLNGCEAGKKTQTGDGALVPILLHANHEHVWLISAVWYYHAEPRLNGRQAEKAF